MAVLPAVLIIQLMKARVASGLPVARAAESTIPTTGWVADPNGRGTFSIISSCVLTMGLCVWSALHLNIPSKETAAQSWVRNMKWMLMGLFGPELVVFSAWRQYVSARTLQNNIAALNKPKIADEVITSLDQPTWSMVHGFYAGMGGFVFDLDTTLASILQTPKPGPQRLTLSPRGIDLLAKCGLLPEISKKEIDDKSKADDIAKALVCLQAGWMVVQVLARIAYGLPVTLLEVNTIGHVVCAFSIYILWWHKPRLVREPTALRGEWVKSVCTFMWMSSSISDAHPNNNVILPNPRRVSELAKLSFYPDHLPEQSRAFEALTEVVSVADQKLNATSLSGFAYREDFGCLRPVNQKQSEKDFPAVADEPGTGTLSASQRRQLRWQLALDAMQTFPALPESLREVEKPPQYCYHFRTDELLSERAGNWPSNALLSDFRGVLMGMALWLATIAFGGVHAAAWSDYFPSEIETWLWRSSSIYIMASGLLWLCINFLGQVSHSFDAYWDKVLARDASWGSYTIIGFLCTVCGFAYGFARIFLVVEAVISLRSLPITAYQTPDWSQLIPHL